MPIENKYPFIYDNPESEYHGERCRRQNVRPESADIVFRDGSSIWDAHHTHVKKLAELPEVINLSEHMEDDRNYRPDHYHSGGIDPWQFIEANLNPQQAIGFHLGNVLKYVARHEKKNGLEDLKKALDSLREGIRLYEKAESDGRTVCDSEDESDIT